MSLKTIIVEDEAVIGEYLEELCKDQDKIELLGNFKSGREALLFAQRHEIDLVFLDIEMPEMNGIVLGEALNAMDKGISLIYTTGYEEYALKAFENDAVDYLLKPYTEELLTKAVDKASILAVKRKSKLEVRTFGYFAVFFKGHPVTFSNAKAKELFALLVDRRGGELSMEKAMEAMWPNRLADGNVKSLYRRAVADLKNTLNSFLGKEIILGMRGSTCLVPDEIECDYFHFMEGDRSAISQYNGYYLMDYFWPEITNSSLKRLADV